MAKPLHDIDDFFFQELHDLSDEPTPSVWQTLDNQLTKQENVAYRRKYFFTKKVAIVLFLLLLSILLKEAGLFNFSKQSNSVKLSTGNKKADDKNSNQIE